MSKITYADKVTLKENPNVADVNKIKAGDLNEIKNVVNANDDKFNYTQEEQRIGTWIDGKPVYRKVLSGMVFDGTRNHNISNIDNITSIDGTLWSGTTQDQATNVFPINTVRVDFPTRALGVYVNKTKLGFDKGPDIGTGFSYRIIVEYTKTTD